MFIELTGGMHSFLLEFLNTWILWDLWYSMMMICTLFWNIATRCILLIKLNDISQSIGVENIHKIHLQWPLLVGKTILLELLSLHRGYILSFTIFNFSPRCKTWSKFMIHPLLVIFSLRFTYVKKNCTNNSTRRANSALIFSSTEFIHIRKWTWMYFNKCWQYLYQRKWFLP